MGVGVNRLKWSLSVGGHGSVNDLTSCVNVCRGQVLRISEVYLMAQCIF